MAEKNTADIGFEKQIWNAACVLRGNMDASEYKGVVLGLIFLKYISDRFEDKYNQLVADGDGFEEDRDEYTSEGIFFVPAGARWSDVSAKAHDPEIGQVIDDAMRAIEKENARLKDILPKNFARPELDKRRLGEVVDLFTNIKMIEHGSEKDILGRTYEYCLSMFAEQEGKRGGEFFTPSCVVRTLVEVLQPFKGRVYDPCCGSGGMFVQSAKFVENHMWLTGFDVPSLATMYVYKPMHGYNLMQAIARVNRVFKDKEGGLIVDYVGIASALKAAMKEYTKRDQSRYGDMDIAKVAYPKFQEKLQVCKDLLHGFDFSGFIGGSPLMMAKLVTGGVNFVLDAKAPKRKDLFLREALLLKQSHSLCSSMTTEQERHEAAYMEAVRSTVVKITYGGSGGKTLSLKEINAQINELLKASIQSQGVISLFDSKKADENISLFDPAVLDEISKMKEKNIAVEILKKLMAEQVSLYKRTNVVQSQKFSEKITQLMNSYYNGLITNEEVIKELLKTAQEITELYNNGKKLGLTQEELAFYDALTKPENIKDFYQNNELIDLTRELTEMLRKNRTIDWQKKETARASMRKMVKHLLKKYKYPPEDYDTAISTVISQCEMWTDNMTA